VESTEAQKCEPCEDAGINSQAITVRSGKRVCRTCADEIASLVAHEVRSREGREVAENLTELDKP
jgi:hypothetical protein